MQTILVTGGAGFIGSHMTDKLIKQHFKVVIFDNLATGEKRFISKAAKLVEGDIRKEDEVNKLFQKNKFTAVFHIAGQASNINSFTNPHFDVETNYIGSINIVSACLKYKVPRLLYASSMSAYGHPGVIPIPETISCQPISYYGISKFAAEKFVLATALRADLKFPFHVTALRMFNVYGPRQSLTNPYQGVMAIFIGNVLRREPIQIFGDGKQTRDFIYIDDITRAWILALDDKRSFNGIYNLGCGKQISLNRLASTIIKLLGHNPKTYPVLYHNSRPGDQRYMQADMRLIKKSLGFKPQISLEAGLQKTIAWAVKEAKSNSNKVKIY